jgi:AraC-like DNA-binding protein
MNGRLHLPVSSGAVVIMNPEDVHCCNPVDNEPWSYLMLYVDAAWLANIQQELAPTRASKFQRFSTPLTTDKDLYGGLDRLYRILTSPGEDQLRKHGALITFFSSVQTSLNSGPIELKDAGHRVVAAAEYIRENRTRTLKLDDLCAASGLSAPYLIRAFKQRYDMTPHAYLINSRIEYCRAQLKRGKSIAEVAMDAGFSDQAHLQRTFKQYMAVTPGQYRSRP